MNLINNPHHILTAYWKYSQFRPLQRDIIQDVLEGKDTIALLPTGGGKSICFQVPALCMEGLCLVISPLVALMHDQVDGLKRKGIRAAYLHAGMSTYATQIALDNCRHGLNKLLYVSPERLLQESFLEQISQMPISMVAIDEAHCISEWGYNFRPSYLKIASIKEYLPNVPFLALTATATPKVLYDIEHNLQLKEPKLFKASFKRDNIQIHVREERNKLGALTQAAKKIKGSAIAYIHNRRKTVIYADHLKYKGLAAKPYHAGLAATTRVQTQQEWIRNKTQTIIGTNAFGMGIDKPDVRLVVNLDIPNTLETYFQEIGRAGRDGQQSWAILWYNSTDLRELDRKIHEYPTPEQVITVLEQLYQFLKIAIGDCPLHPIPFDWMDFSKQYGYHTSQLLTIFYLLEQMEVLTFTQTQQSASKIRIWLAGNDLYAYMVEHPSVEPLLKTILRKYGGVLEDTVAFDEQHIATTLKTTSDKIQKVLLRLHDLNILDYQPYTRFPQITFHKERVQPVAYMVDKQYVEQRATYYQHQLEAVKQFVLDDKTCRVVNLLKYFGEILEEACGHCDVCLHKKNAEQLSKGTLEQALEKSIINILSLNKPMSLEALETKLLFPDRQRMLSVLENLLLKGSMEVDENKLFGIKR